MGNGYLQRISNSFLDKVNDCGLHQTNEQLTRGDAVPDIFLTNRPSLVTKTTITPGLGNVVLTGSHFKAAKLRPIARKISIWRKKKEKKKKSLP